MSRILIACEFSGIVRDSFLAEGHDAWSCDLLNTEKEGPHSIGDVIDCLHDDWDLLIAHPPCTYLANSGVRWLYGGSGIIIDEDRWEKMKAGAEFFKALLNAPIPKIAVENPIIHKSALAIIGKTYNQIIQPWQFGHGETKATCLWLKNLPKLIPTSIVTGRFARVHLASPNKNRWKERSRTLKGIAEAMAKQWGRL